MSLTLADVRRIAVRIGQEQQPPVEVTAVTRREGASSSAEVIFIARNRRAEPCELVIGVSRQSSEIDCQNALRSVLISRLGQEC